MPSIQFGKVQTIVNSQPALPTPLFKDLSPSTPIPFTAFGPLRPAIEAIQTLTQAPASDRDAKCAGYGKRCRSTVC